MKQASLLNPNSSQQNLTAPSQELGACSLPSLSSAIVAVNNTKEQGASSPLGSIKSILKVTATVTTMHKNAGTSAQLGATAKELVNPVYVEDKLETLKEAASYATKLLGNREDWLRYRNLNMIEVRLRNHLHPSFAREYIDKVMRANGEIAGYNEEIRKTVKEIMECNTGAKTNEEIIYMFISKLQRSVQYVIENYFRDTTKEEGKIYIMERAYAMHEKRLMYIKQLKNANETWDTMPELPTSKQPTVKISKTVRYRYINDELSNDGSKELAKK